MTTFLSSSTFPNRQFVTYKEIFFAYLRVFTKHLNWGKSDTFFFIFFPVFLRFSIQTWFILFYDLFHTCKGAPVLIKSFSGTNKHSLVRVVQSSRITVSITNYCTLRVLFYTHSDGFASVFGKIVTFRPARFRLIPAFRNALARRLKLSKEAKLGGNAFSKDRIYHELRFRQCFVFRSRSIDCTLQTRVDVKV